MTAAAASDPLAAIPHRAPILTLDHVIEQSSTRAVADRRVVPGWGVRDGALDEPLLIEGLAQTAALLQAARDAELGRASRPGYLVGVRDLEVLRPARVDERVRFTVELAHRLDPVTVVRAEARLEPPDPASLDPVILARGELKFFVPEEA